jgi:hypothetical protein
MNPQPGCGCCGSSVIALPGCPCPTTPTSLTMTSLDTTCSHGMFQSASLLYQPTPTSFGSLLLPDHVHLSTSLYPDLDTGDDFYYLFACEDGFYTLSRIYPHSIFGSPYRDVVRFTWPIPWSGNSCSPFLLTYGLIFRFGDPACRVIISM